MPNREDTNEQRLRAAVESSPSGILMVDAEGRIVLLNREIERLFGYPREELLGKPVDVLVPARFAGGHPGHRTKFFAEPKVRRMGAGRDLYGRRKDGSEVPVEIGLTPVVTDQGLFVLSSIVDISARRAAEEERRALEAQLQQAQKMQAVGTLAGGIAHDFNNILGAIIGYVDLLKAEVKDERALADLGEVARAATRGRDVVQRMLALSRRQQPSVQPLDLTEAVQDCQNLLRASLPTSIELKVTASDSAPRVNADRTSVLQILLNLANNAAQAMPEGGTIEFIVGEAYAHDRVVRENPRLRESWYGLLAVRDQGLGMDEATRARAKEPFFSTKPSGVGTGLGLAMVESIMAAHGGAVLLESEVGKGTVVRCLFPMVEAEYTPRHEVDPATPTGHGERVLFVDDEPALVRIGERQLANLGYAVEGYTDPAAALERLAEDPAGFDVVVTDFSMPRMDGLALARAVHRLRPELPVVLMTGYLGDVPMKDVDVQEARRVLNKPVDMSELAATLAGLLRERPD